MFAIESDIDDSENLPGVEGIVEVILSEMILQLKVR